MRTHHRLSLERIEEAAQIIDPVFLRSPQFVSLSLGEMLGVQLLLKVETMNPIRSFKGRGTDFLVSQVQPGTALLCASAGNFGQAMAYAGRKRGVKVTVYASTMISMLLNWKRSVSHLQPELVSLRIVSISKRLKVLARSGWSCWTLLLAWMHSSSLSAMAHCSMVSLES
jgi:hypothetical protein